MMGFALIIFHFQLTKRIGCTEVQQQLLQSRCSGDEGKG